jgi:hypothetical protein
VRLVSEGPSFLDQFWFSGRKKLKPGVLQCLRAWVKNRPSSLGGTEYPTRTKAIGFSLQAFCTSSTFLASKTRKRFRALFCARRQDGGHGMRLRLLCWRPVCIVVLSIYILPKGTNLFLCGSE